MTIRQSLQGAGFKPHNNKAAELVASKFHSSIRNVRIVCRTGTNKSTGKTIGSKQTQFQAVYVNKQGHWRTIASGSAFKGAARFASALIAIEVGAEEASTCKCGAKKFKAKSGNVVCADACWANHGWSGSKKTRQGTKKNSTSQPIQTKRTSTKKVPQIKKETKTIEGVYTDFVPGQLVKVVEPQQNTLSEFIGTVTKVEPVGDNPKRPLTNVSVLWMHSGLTERHNNYNTRTGTATYLVAVA
jgi:nitrite reductase/ring-hydroxylating ferredoxin subunit